MFAPVALGLLARASQKPQATVPRVLEAVKLGQCAPGLLMWDLLLTILASSSGLTERLPDTPARIPSLVPCKNDPKQNWGPRSDLQTRQRDCRKSGESAGCARLPS